MRTQITRLREQLARQIRARGADDPQVAHLRWQIASLERQAHWRDQAAGMFGASPRLGDPASPADGGR